MTMTAYDIAKVVLAREAATAQPIDLNTHESLVLAEGFMRLFKQQGSNDPHDEAGIASKANSRQIAGAHYGLSEFQHWDVVVMFKLDYFQGQITKYVMRWKQ